MRIGILGAGGMAGALGTQWVRAGHEVMLGGRDPGRTRAAAERIAAGAPAEPRVGPGLEVGARVRLEADARTVAVRTPAEVRPEPDPETRAEAGVRPGPEVGVWAGSLWDAAGFGDVTLLAVTHEAVPAVLGAVGGALRGRPLVDCVNAVLPGFLLDGDRAFAERVAALVPGTPVVKAFNLCHVDVWRLTPPAFDGRALVVPLCGDDPAALETVRRLVRDIGCTPADGGGLARAAQLEATAAFAIGLWTSGVEAQAMLPPLAYSPPAG